MKKSVFYVLFFLAFLSCQNTVAKVREKPIYMFGFAISFVDSLAYITDVQYIESAYIDSKSKFLVGRNMYSVQLQHFLEKNEGCQHPVTSIFFGKKKKMEKKMLSIRQKYERGNVYVLKNIACNFRPEYYEEQQIIESSESDEADDKASKKSRKK